MYRSSALRLNLFPQGFNDGTVIPKEGFSVIASGNYNRVPVILGSDVTEFSSFAIKTDITEALSTTTTTTYDRLMQLANSVWKFIPIGTLYRRDGKSAFTGCAASTGICVPLFVGNGSGSDRYCLQYLCGSGAWRIEGFPA